MGRRDLGFLYTSITHRMKLNRLTTMVILAMVLGVLVGYACHAWAPTPEAAKEIAGYFGLLTDIFLRMIKMIIAPLVFATLAAGMSTMGDSRTVGRIGTRALAWFMGASLISLTLGLLIANGFQYLLSGDYWISMFPGLALVLLILTINVIADRLRAALGPRST